MVELEEKKVKVEGETVKVYVKFSPRLGADSRRRFYTHDALQLIKETHPKLVVGKVLKPCTAKNYGESLEGEWVFELVKKEVAKKRTTTTRKTLKSAKKEAKEETKEVIGD